MLARFPRRSVSRAFTGAMLLAVACALSGCGGAANSFDPTDMLSFLDRKKPLPGTRHPVFPEGVPGVEQGVPKELYKGTQQNDLAATGPAAPATAAQPNAAPPAAAAEAPPPEPQPKKRVRTAKRRSITAPPPDEAPAAPPPQQQQPAAPQPRQQQMSPFPAPLPSGSFSQ